MELRVWVDGTQRVVCGVKLTTTCQEIVFALAHATQQAGRFTMIERWRNNERLLSPNEQPLVTLQRWGDHMNEVEFILRKTSTDITANPPVNQLQPQPQHQSIQQQQQQSQPPTRLNNEESTQQVVNTNGRRDSPLISSTNKPPNDSSHDGMYQHQHYNVIRHNQPILGPLTSTNSSLGLGSSYLQPKTSMTRLPNTFRASMSASTLPNVTNNISDSPSSTTSLMRQHYADDQVIDNNASSSLRNSHNGYSIQNEMQLQQNNTANRTQVEQSQVSKNHPFEDLYSKINKKRNNQPPAVPAKPRVVGPIAPITSMPLHPQQISSANNAQMNFYHTNQTPLNLYQNSLRPRHPPGYLDYIEALAHRNSLPHQLINNPNYAQQSHHNQSNMFQRPYDPQQVYGMHQNRASPNSLSVANRYRYSVNGPLTNYDQNQEMRPASSMQNVNAIRPKLMETGLVVNRGSAVNVKLTPSNHNLPSNSLISSERTESCLSNTNENGSSVSKIGHDMLKVIEEQKKVLVNQKNELDRLDNDQEYWETKQNSEQAELVNRIESEIHQLEELWKENQAQIRKLENQDFEKELEELKSEQVKMEAEIEKQKKKLGNCENEIVACKTKIEKLEMELANQAQENHDESTSSSNDESDELYMNILNSKIKEELDKSGEGAKSIHTNGIIDEDVQNGLETKGSEDEDYEDDSAGDASDDLNLPVQENKHRTAKDVAYVDKRGLISGIRSLKLDKSRSINRHVDPIRSTENINSLPTTSSPGSKELAPMNNIDNGSPENNNQYPDKTANNNNKYEFLMSL